MPQALRTPRLLLISLILAPLLRAGDIAPLPYVVAPVVPDALELQSPSAVHVGGWLGHRVAINESDRLLKVDLVPLLAGFKVKPGSHPWIGEHIGKWIHASTLAWANTGDAALKEKLDDGVRQLIAAQEADGYLGTYTKDKRFGLYDGADWDVWSSSYCIIGLLTYYQYTGYEPALEASRRAADLLLRTFPAEKSILSAGTHVGMAATSVLDPIVQLYRLTGDPRYLAFARYLVGSWDEEGGPAIIHSLLVKGRVDLTANAKAYEMLCNLLGLSELARVTGDREYVRAPLAAWADIVANRLYVTGTTSAWEHFQDNHTLYNDNASDIGETCVTTTWIQLNLSLLQLTGEARFGDEIERSYYNHLAAAQAQSGGDWCYYTPLEGRKAYDSGITCCHSSGPRAMALAPQSAYLVGHGDTVYVDTLESSSARVTLGDEAVLLEQVSGFPRRGTSTIGVRLSHPATFAVRVRVPDWALPATVGGTVVSQPGWAEVPMRTWRDGDSIPVTFALGGRVIEGTYGNTGRSALAWGPFVLAYQASDNPTLPPPRLAGLAGAEPPRLLPGDGPLQFEATLAGAVPSKARFVTFADAGADGGVYRVWLRSPGTAAPPHDSLLIGGTEARSKGSGPPGGSIIDDDFATSVTTRDGTRAAEDWFSVTLMAKVSARRFTFAQGAMSGEGGWFDTSGGKPRLEIQKKTGGPWESIGILKDYPETTAERGSADAWYLSPGREFTLRVPACVTFVAVRVIGRAASGSNPGQAYASCAELQAFDR